MAKAALPLLCLLLISACAAKTGSGLNQNAQTEPPTFYSLGLSGIPGESAEEVLLRAHAGDTFAMALAVVGYDSGINGFPRDRHLSLIWADAPWEWGADIMRDFLQAYWLRDRQIPSEDARIVRLFYYESGSKSPLADVFKKAGIFDLEGVLREIRKTPLSPEGEKRYASFKKKMTRPSSLPAWARLARTLVNNPYTKKSWLTNDESGYEARQFLFFAATTHDPEKERPDWRAERVLSYIEQRVKEGRAGVAWALSLELNARLAFDPSPALDIIRRAHAGEASAMRSLARGYISGETGFLRNPALTSVWFKYAAFKGDSVSMAALANEAYESGKDAEALSWSSLAMESGDARVRGMARWIQQHVEARASASEMERARALVQEYREKIRRAPESSPFMETQP